MAFYASLLTFFVVSVFYSMFSLDLGSSFGGSCGDSFDGIGAFTIASKSFNLAYNPGFFLKARSFSLP